MLETQSGPRVDSKTPSVEVRIPESNISGYVHLLRHVFDLRLDTDRPRGNQEYHRNCSENPKRKLARETQLNEILEDPLKLEVAVERLEAELRRLERIRGVSAHEAQACDLDLALILQKEASPCLLEMWEVSCRQHQELMNYCVMVGLSYK